jgi:hypothetical protein
LKVDVGKRIKAEEALQHAWFKKYYRSKATRQEMASDLIIID